MPKRAWLYALQRCLSGPGITSTTKAIARALADRMDVDGASRWYRGRRDFAAREKCKPHTLAHHVETLVAAGYLRWEAGDGGRGQTARYWATLPVVDATMAADAGARIELTQDRKRVPEGTPHTSPRRLSHPPVAPPHRPARPRPGSRSTGGRQTTPSGKNPRLHVPDHVRDAVHAITADTRARAMVLSWPPALTALEAALTTVSAAGAMPADLAKAVDGPVSVLPTVPLRAARYPGSVLVARLPGAVDLAVTRARGEARRRELDAAPARPATSEPKTAPPPPSLRELRERLEAKAEQERLAKLRQAAQETPLPRLGAALHEPLPAATARPAGTEAAAPVRCNSAARLHAARNRPAAADDGHDPMPIGPLLPAAAGDVAWVRVDELLDVAASGRDREQLLEDVDVGRGSLSPAGRLAGGAAALARGRPSPW